MVFDTPQAALAIQVTSHGLPISFYNGDRLVASIVIETIPSPYFTGFISDEPFDRIEFEPYPGGYHVLANTYFSAVPSPGAALLLPAVIAFRRRRIAA